MPTLQDRVLRHAPWAPKPDKYQAELKHWRGELEHLHDWYVQGGSDWWGIPPPTPEQKIRTSAIWSTNAVHTMHDLRPAYLEELQIQADALEGERVLEVGCGPLAPVLQFTGCERHGIDPLIDRYVAAGWPLYDLDVTFVNGGAERMPYPDAWFDTVISVNALDHVDDFAVTAREVQRVIKPGGVLLFEVEYHAPTVTEPLELNDDVILDAFENVELAKVRDIDSRELFARLVARFGLDSAIVPSLGSGERWATWHGTRN